MGIDGIEVIGLKSYRSMIQARSPLQRYKQIEVSA